MLETMLNGSLVEVSSLDAEWLLDFAADAEVRERQAGRAKLRAAARWCVLHPATAESGFVTWSDTGLPGLCPDEEGSGWGGDAAGGGVHPRAVRRRARGVHPDRAAVVGRRPGPPTPTPPPLGRRRSTCGGAVEGPQDRPGHPQSLAKPPPHRWTPSSRTGSARVGGGRSRPRSPRPSPPTTRTCWRPERSTAGTPGECGCTTAGSPPTAPTTGSAPPISRSPATPWTSRPFTTWSVTRPPN